MRILLFLFVFAFAFDKINRESEMCVRPARIPHLHISGISDSESWVGEARCVPSNSPSGIYQLRYLLTYQCLVWPGFGLARLLASSTAAATGDFSHKTSYSQKSERAVGFSRKKHRLSYDTHTYTYPGPVMTVPFHLRRAHPQHDMRKRLRRRLTV